jgi:hypothetical protein
MTLFLIAYDLNKPEQNCEAIHKQLKNWGAKHVLESTWMLVTDLNVKQMRNILTDTEGLLDSSDGVVIAQVTDWSAAGTLIGLTKI